MRNKIGTWSQMTPVIAAVTAYGYRISFDMQFAMRALPSRWSWVWFNAGHKRFFLNMKLKLKIYQCLFSMIKAQMCVVYYYYVVYYIFRLYYSTTISNKEICLSLKHCYETTSIHTPLCFVYIGILISTTDINFCFAIYCLKIIEFSIHK